MHYFNKIYYVDSTRPFSCLFIFFAINQEKRVRNIYIYIYFKISFLSTNRRKKRMEKLEDILQFTREDITKQEIKA